MLHHYLPLPLRRINTKTWGRASQCQLATDFAPPRAVVFVHGFGDDPVKAWQGFPEKIADSKYFKTTDIYYYGYESKKQQAMTSAIQLRSFITELAERPASQVVHPSLPIGEPRRRLGWKYEQITLAAYSLGAIVTRHALLDLTRARRRPKWLTKIRLGLFAPAHNGARIIPIGLLALRGLSELLLQTEAVSNLTEAILRRKWTTLNDLDPESPVIRAAREETRSLLQTKPVPTHLVARSIYGSADKIVIFAPYCEDKHELPIEGADHIDVPKPAKGFKEPFEFLTSLTE